MKPKACVKSWNSNTRCRFPFTTLQPPRLRRPPLISCSESFVLAMKTSSEVPRPAHYLPTGHGKQEGWIFFRDLRGILLNALRDCFIVHARNFAIEEAPRRPRRRRESFIQRHG